MNRFFPDTAAVLIAAFCFVSLLAVACSAPEPLPMVSLADQLDPAEAPGPWRSVARSGIDPAWFAEAEGLAVMRDGVQRPATELAGEVPATIRTLIRKSALIQTERFSTLSLPIKLLAGERVVSCLRYPGRRKGSSGRWEPEGVRIHFVREGEEGLRTRILREGEEGPRRIGGPPGEYVRRDTLVSEGGADRIEIVHKQEPGTPLKLLSADILVLAAGVPDSEAERARDFLRFGGSDTSLLFSGAAGRRLVRVSRYGMTAKCVVLAPGDALELSLPPGRENGRLAFHVLRPPDGEVRLTVGCDDGLRWPKVARWGDRELPRGEWKQLTADLRRFPGGTGRIRLTHTGDSGPLGIAEPVLLPPAGRAPDAPNLVLVVLDTLRADRLGCYGYRSRPTSDRLNRTLEAWGFSLFRRAYSASPWTIPATAKFMSSRYLDFHGVRQIPESTTMLAEFLRRKDYYCAAFTGGGLVAVHGMEQGFHQYGWSSSFGKVEGSFPQAEEWLRQWEGGPFFLFVHTYETHRPYTRDTFCRDLPRGRLGDLSAGESLFNREASNATSLTGEERTYVQAAYDGGVYHASEATADLLDTLQESGLQRCTVVVILSDHGEEMWDRHQICGAHGHSLHAEMLDVPLLVHSPGIAGRGLQVLEEPVSTVDLPPTVADLLGLPWEGGADGVSLRPLLTGGEIHRTVPIIADLQRGRIHPEVPPQACVILDGVKYIEPLGPAAAVGKGSLGGVVPPTVPSLYRLSSDPRERQNLVSANHELAVRMRDLLRRAMLDALQPDDLKGDEGLGGDRPLSGELEQQLQALGYLARTSRSPSAAGPDTP